MYDLINLQIEHAMADYPAIFEIVAMTENTIYINTNTYRKSYRSPRFQDKVIELMNKLNVLSGRRVFCVVRNNEEWVRVDELLHEDGKFIEHKAHGYEVDKKNNKSLPDINKELNKILHKDVLRANWQIGITATYDSEIIITIKLSENQKICSYFVSRYLAEPNQFTANLLMTLYTADILIGKRVYLHLLVNNDEIDRVEICHNYKIFSDTNKLSGFAISENIENNINELNKQIHQRFVKNNHAAFKIVTYNHSLVFIHDLYEHNESVRQHKTITNDAEWVVEALCSLYPLNKRRLFYRDSEGQIDEIVHNGRRFIEFRTESGAIVEILASAERFASESTTAGRN
jgi:hypothetical protein